MATGSDLVLEDPPAKRERRKSVGPRLVRAIEALVLGEHKTIKDAAAAAGLTREALSKAVSKPHVQQYMQRRIQEVLRVGAVRAGSRMVELLQSTNELVCFQASRFVLATGAGIAPPDERPPVNVGVNVSVGYVIDTSRRRQGRPEVEVGGGARVLIEGEAVGLAAPVGCSAVEVTGE